jgi:hypothetical protein
VDARTLGAAIAAISLDGAPLGLAHPALATGFHPAERHATGVWRWTGGRARLELGAVDHARLLCIEVEALYAADAA